MRRKSVWTELPNQPEYQGANYWKVRCDICREEAIKASPRNVELWKVGHHGKHHFGTPWAFTVIPMKREEAGDAAKNG